MSSLTDFLTTCRKLLDRLDRERHMLDAYSELLLDKALPKLKQIEKEAEEALKIQREILYGGTDEHRGND